MRLRDREEIFASILVSTGSGDGISLTKLMFNSYLTYFQILEYSKTLIERGFLEYDKTDKTFNTTPSGFKFLELYNEMSQIIKGQQWHWKDREDNPSYRTDVPWHRDWVYSQGNNSCMSLREITKETRGYPWWGRLGPTMILSQNRISGSGRENFEVIVQKISWPLSTYL